MLNISRGKLARPVALALALAFAGSALAQSNSSGRLAGRVAAGESVLLENSAIGLHREIQADTKGRFQFRSLPVGTYVVKIKHANGEVETLPPVSVRVGTTTRVN